MISCVPFGTASIAFVHTQLEISAQFGQQDRSKTVLQTGKCVKRKSKCTQYKLLDLYFIFSFFFFPPVIKA